MLPLRPDLAPLPVPPPDTSAGHWRAAVGIAVAGALGAALGLFGLEWMDRFEPSGLGSIVAVVAGAPGVLAVHELGHVAGGRLAGWRFVLFVAGPLRVERQGDRLRWGLNTSLALAGGLALSVPTDAHDLGRRTALMVAGGPAASLLLAGLGFALGGAWAVVGLISLGIAAVTLFPGRAGGFLTDGARLLRLARGGAGADAEAAVLAVFAQSVAGVRPRDWDADLMDRLGHAAGVSLAESAGSLVTARAVDTGDADAARAALVRRIDGWAALPPGIRGGLVADAALFEAGARGDAARAQAWLDRLPTRAVLADPGGLALAQAATAWADRDAEAARARAEAARATLADALDAGTAAARRDWLAGFGVGERGREAPPAAPRAARLSTAPPGPRRG